MWIRRGIWILAWALAGGAQAMSSAEQAKVEALIARVAAAKDAVFIRNGNEYPAANAAEFLRRKCGGKWSAMASAREFVTGCASESSTSGKPYLIRQPGGAARPSAQVLNEWLQEIERAGAVH